LAEIYLSSVSKPSAAYPSDAEVKEAYETNKAAFFMPKSYRLAQIYVDTKPDEKAAAKQLASIKEALKAPKADFAAIAAERSQEKASAARGGELGWLAESQIQPEIRAELPDLKLGAISEPFKLNDGWHILKVLDVKEASTLTLEQARPTLVQQLRASKAKANSDAYMAELLKTNPVAINELALPKALSTK
jgi:parvulin-like peptidyl-prolyl isomerase